MILGTGQDLGQKLEFSVSIFLNFILKKLMPFLKSSFKASNYDLYIFKYELSQKYVIFFS